jgi:hypothetical protein
MARPAVYIETYGCQMNASDFEFMYGRLAVCGPDLPARAGGGDGAGVQAEHDQFLDSREPAW